ncbi:hypothetical protein BH10BAC5_BH10BAC5_27850 [soil metagenome]
MKTSVKKSASKAQSTFTPEHIKNKLFPIVAIGASAGGLEAYNAILRNLPAETGMAYVIIQHLDPVHKSFLNEIVSRETDMKVNDIKSGIQPKPDNVYIIQPNSTVTFVKGKFHCVQRDKMMHKPINLFMSSLAKDDTHNVIGVILSGADADGVIGMEDIKIRGGITFAQDKATAKFPEMPQKAVTEGIIDFICTPQAIAKKLIRISRNSNLINSKKVTEVIADDTDDMAKIFKLLHSNNGIDFQNYKPTTIRRRLLRRMEVHKISNIKEYLKLLKTHSEELDSLCGDILIGVTSFFRDPSMYESLKKKVFPAIFLNKDVSSPVRIWVSGCSSGQEAYSMAIAILEYQEKISSKIPVQIFSTDLSENGIKKARAGIYTQNIKDDVSPERLRKYFEKHNDVYRINKKIRSMCIFARQNLIQDTPFSKIDLISCRNVLIYLGQALQNKIMPLFHYSLSASGFLVLGSSETIGQFSDLFELQDKKNKIYRKKNLTTRVHNDYRSIKPFLSASEMKKEDEKTERKLSNEEDYFKTADNIILNKYSPPSVLVNISMEVIQFRGKSNDFFKIQQGKPTFNLLKITKDELNSVLKILVRQSIEENSLVRKNDIEIISRGEKKVINIIVIPLGGRSNFEKLYLVIFEENYHVFYPSAIAISDSDSPGNKNSVKHDSERVLNLKKELLISNENLQSYIEELQSANEEIQSSNEELQSTNEELETAKEEIQSTNEELTTVNEELMNMNTELVVSNSDLNNLLSSINIPVILLDNEMKIRRFTNTAGKLLNLIPGDVGRKLTDININLSVSNLKNSIAEVRKSLLVKEKLVKDSKNNWYFMRLRPYMTVEKKIDGVIIAFIDVTELKRSISDLEKSNLEVISVNKELKTEIGERKNAEGSLRKLSRHLISAEEAAKKRFSRDLHDSVNQILSVVKMKLHSTETAVKNNDNKYLLKDITDARKLLEKALSEVRNISKNLRLHGIDDLGLKGALKSMVEEFTRKLKIKINFRMSNVKNISKEMEMNAYRIIQEALYNIEKHSGARNVKIGLSVKNNELHVVVVDDGHGFTITDKKTLHPKMHKYGLLGMKERAESFGGSFELRSKKGKGTEIFAALPKKLIIT